MLVDHVLLEMKAVIGQQGRRKARNRNEVLGARVEGNRQFGAVAQQSVRRLRMRCQFGPFDVHLDEIDAARFLGRHEIIDACYRNLLFPPH